MRAHVQSAIAVIAVQFGLVGSIPAQAIVMPLAPVFITLGVAAQRRADRGPRRADNDDRILQCHFLPPPSGALNAHPSAMRRRGE